MTEPAIAWVAWRITEDGLVEARVARATTAGGVEREQASFASLEEASDRFGPGFAEVARLVLAAGSRSGRWRP